MKHLLTIAMVLAGCAGDGTHDRAPFIPELPAHFPSASAPQNNPATAESIELGRHLFYDTRLSFNGAVACASCHKQEYAFADSAAISPGASGELGSLNAPSLANAVYVAPLGWAHASLTEIEEQLRGPMFGRSPVEMGMSGFETEIEDALRNEPRYQDLFGLAFPDEGDDATSLVNARLALASFVRSLVSYRSPFDEFLSGNRSAISPSAQRGSELFFSDRLRCGSCHSGFAFTSAIAGATQSEPFHNIGLYNIDDAGGYPSEAMGLIAESGIARDMGRFRIPSLRNVAVTAPYMHDGSVATLQEVIEIYENGGRVITSGTNAGDGRQSPLRSARLANFSLTDSERADLLAFLESLTDHALLADQSHANPW